LTAGEFGPDRAADRAGFPHVLGPHAAGPRVARGLAPGQVPALEGIEDGQQQRRAVEGSRPGAGGEQGRGWERAGAAVG
jgi:hypothetical protein